MNFVQLAVPFFILLIAVEILYGYWRKQQTYRLNDSINSLQMGVISQFKNILRIGFSGIVFSSLVAYFGVERLPTDNVWIWVVTFIAYDFTYYWKHRMGHEWRIMWAAHAAHHQSEEYNLSTALRQTGTDYIGFVFYIPIFLAGVPVEVFISVSTLNLVYQFWVHTEHVKRVGWLEWILVTPSNHRVHHARNPVYIDRNYGGVFILWDRLFGSFQDELTEQPCVYGVTKALRSWNPLWANFHVWYDTFMISMKTKRWKDKLVVWFKGPGWYPEDMAPKTKVDWQYDKFNPQISTFVKITTFVHFWVFVLMSLWLPQAQAELPRAFVLALFFWSILSFYVQGVWMEARAYAERMEWLRLVSIALILFVSSIAWPDLPETYFLLGAAYTLVSALTLVSWRYFDRPKLTVPAS